MLDWQRRPPIQPSSSRRCKVDLFEDEVYVFTPKGEVKSLSAGATPLDFAYEVHTDVGHRCVGAKVNGKIVPLSYELKRRRHRRGAHLQAGARALARLARRWSGRPVRATRSGLGSGVPTGADSEQAGREQLAEALRRDGLPSQKLSGSAMLAEIIASLASSGQTSSIGRSAAARSPRRWSSRRSPAPAARRVCRVGRQRRIRAAAQRAQPRAGANNGGGATGSQSTG